MPTLRLLGAVLLLGLNNGGVEPGAASLLDVVWRVDLGPSDRLVYRGAVCSDGTSYLSDSTGRVVAISPQGAIISDMRVSIGKPLAAACNKAGQLVLVTRDASGATALTTVPRGSSQPPSSIPLRSGGDTILGPAHSLTIGEDGTVVLVLADLARSGVRLAFVDANGDVRGLTAPIPDESGPLGGAGSVIWDTVQQRASYLPLGRYTFETYDATGTHVGRRNLGARLSPTAQERTKRVLQLRNGEFVVQIVGGIRGAQPPYAWKPTARLELLSPTLNAVAMLDDGGPGLLIGADDDGYLYFQNIVRGGGTVIIKTKLNVQRHY